MATPGTPDCVPYDCPPPVPLADWPDSDGRLKIPPELHDFDAGQWCVGHEHGPGAEALSDIVWLHWCARVGDLLIVAHYKESVGYFVSVLRAADGQAVKELKVRPPQELPGGEGYARQRTWARATAIAAAEELRGSGGRPSDDVLGDGAAWLRRQLGSLGRRPGS